MPLSTGLGPVLVQYWCSFVRRSDQVLRYIIEPVMEDHLGYKTVRADRISQPGMITNQVIEHLIEDELVIADLTGSNPNVFYELAIRHATRKPVVTMIEAGERIPFDISQSRTIQFSYRDLDSVAVCKEDLENQVRALEANPADFFTLISVAVDLKSMYESGDPEERRDAQVLASLQEVQAEISRIGAEVARLRGRVTPDYPRRLTTDALANSSEATSGLVGLGTPYRRSALSDISPLLSLEEHDRIQHEASERERSRRRINKEPQVDD